MYMGVCACVYMVRQEPVCIKMCVRGVGDEGCDTSLNLRYRSE